ncbi:ubiquinone biosynthesis hydrox [Metschnikowia bicuspidata var. bicuspidata NRRL YB-4993]|uniref:Ubiquinone biosynthesis monooxygenase COQ6, mitochondrial n=1 Tax=Metschnikowia bicuspidata var. bicuspidata NRRL YB-4993 TaxID=869754 RepID=A0A1A0HAW4_9ASCO|nr:ubiquinone biosynthesis hydrox [Metschnikowia bicuspidata var. bicuspidata NRRL YB-4993]OBA21022.1 ubiquinone biosynthesis hydrox [Metschnikowia bicuspidata var. bicuspidata NRRL YB-4993]
MRSFLRLLSAAARPVLQDVVIVGGGPAGLSLMAALKNSPKTQHLLCTLVEGLDLLAARDFVALPPEAFSNRIVSLTPKSVQFMKEKSGSWPFLQEARVQFYDNMIAYDSQDAAARIHFDSSTLRGAGDADGGDLDMSSAIAAMCEVVHIQGSLLGKLDELKEEFGDEDDGLRIVDRAKVVDITQSAENAGLDWPVVTLDSGEQLQARLLVGADGQNSPVRKYADIASRGWSYERFGVVGTVKLQFEDYRAVAWQRFLTTGPLAILPLPGDNATFVWSTTPELAAILQQTDPEIFPHLLNAAMTLDEVDLNYLYGVLKADPADTRVIQDIAWRTLKMLEADLDENFPVPIRALVPGSRARFPLKMLQADAYMAPRVALVGDAAHTVHPLAGQGLNMGQLDVAALVQALETGVDRGLDIGSTLVLEKYNADAWPANHMLMGVCDKLHKVFSTDFGPLVFLRGTGLKTLNAFDSVKQLMIKSISGR